MKSRYSLGWALMLIAMALSFVPAATALVQPAAALSACDWAQFVADVTVPDGTTFAPNTAFTKTWRLKNIGTCTWTTSYALVFDTGDRMGGPTSVNLSNTVYPGQTVDLSISLTAPAAAGHYIGYWKFKNAAGVLFGIGSTMNKSWWVEINVSGSSPGVAYDFAANYCSATWYSLQYNLPCPGTDGDSRGFVLKVDRPQLEDGTYDTGSGLITNPQNAYNGDIHGAFPAFRVQSGDKFRATVNCAYGATSCFVTFRLDYQIGSGPINTLWSFREKYEGLYFRTNVDLSSLAGQDVKFILTVLATGSAVGDRALWSNPAIVRPGGGPPPPPPPPSGNKFDFGTAASPVAAGYTRVTETTAFSSGGYGWTDTSSLESRDRGAPADDLLRDFVMSSTAARTFKLTIPNGSYAVTVTMGDHDYAHDNMVVKANGTTMLADVDSAVGAFTVRTFNVTVTGGTLALEFSDAGGIDPTWIVNALTVSSSSPPPAGCDRAQFIADVTVPDGTVFLPGASFSKTWRLKNVGTCTWTTSYLLVFDTGDKMGGPDAMNLPNIVTPGQTVDLTVNLTAPVSAGSYRGYWKFQNANGVRFGIGADGTKSWWVDIRVAGPTPTPGTPGPSPTPGTGTMYDFAANACSAVWSSDAGRLPCPGTDGDQRGFVLKVSNPQLENGTVDPRLGLLTYPQNIWNGYILGIFPPYHVKTGDRFRSIVNCAYGATSCYVIFRLDYQTGTGPITTYWAFIEKYEGQYYQADLDLSPLVGQDIKFILHVLSAGSPTGDRALWVAPIIYNPASIVTAGAPITATATPTAPTPTATMTLQAPTPTATTTSQAPTPTATGTSSSGWNNYQNVKYGFSFAFPPGSSIASQSDNAGRVYLPFAPATNLAQKYVDVSVVEGAATCKSPQTNPQASSENVTINGIQFLKETGSEGAAGNIYDWTGYSTTKGTACISLTFVLHSTNPGVYPTPPPLFDKAAESAVFSSIMATYASQ